MAAATAFGAGCCSGITAGVVSEWTVQGVMDSRKKKKTEHTSTFERSRSEGALSRESNASRVMRKYTLHL